MSHRIEITFKKHLPDPTGEKTLRRIHGDLEVDAVTDVRTVDVYNISGSLEKDVLQQLAVLYADPVTQVYSIDRPAKGDFDWLIETGFLPGVTDNVGRTATETLIDLTGVSRGEMHVFSSRQYRLSGEISRKHADFIASSLLANTLIQHVMVISRDKFDFSVGMDPYLPEVHMDQVPPVENIRLEGLDDRELMRLSDERCLSLSLEEMHAARKFYARADVRLARKKAGLDEEPTDVELETIAQTWSEHCKHKIFAAEIEYTDENGKTQTINSLYKTYIQGATSVVRKKLGERDWCRSVFTDNAGVVSFNERINLAFKVETHNSPSALDPYGGALTGIVGVNRDPFGTGMGAKLLFNTDIFCFAPPDYDQNMPARLIHPRQLAEGVREGVEHGGNKSGIPTVNGSVTYDSRYLGKPLVYCGTCGIMPPVINGEPSENKKAVPGDIIVMCGGRVGKDGIHGATFSSTELHEGSPATAVQIGDPITQKIMFDFLIIARDRGLYNSITDNGAGGLASSIGEMAVQSGGATVELSDVPLKYTGLAPWEIWLSEAQERMTLSLPPEKLDEFMDLAKHMNCEATAIGRFNDSGRLDIAYMGKPVAMFDMEFLHDGVPEMKLRARWSKPELKMPGLPDTNDYTDALKQLLGRWNICSKENIVRQYDHEVQARTVGKPMTGKNMDSPADAAVVLAELDGDEAIVVSNGIVPRYSDIDAGAMAACAMDEAVRNALCVGASMDHMSALDNFCWPDPLPSDTNPDAQWKLAQLVRANQALYSLCTAWDIPLISGKDSMKNDYRIGNVKISVPPTLLISLIGRIDDVSAMLSMNVRKPGDIVYVLGLTANEMGASEYYALYGGNRGAVPVVKPAQFRHLYETLASATKKRLLVSCHDCSDGGLAVALAEAAFAGDLGMEIEINRIPHVHDAERNDILLFSESAGRFVITTDPDKASELEELFRGQPLERVGVVTAEKRFVIYGLDGRECIDADIEKLKKAWQTPLTKLEGQ